MTEEVTREKLIEDVSRSLMDIRKEVRLTQDELANILGISKNTIFNAEKDVRPLSWTVVVTILLLFGHTVIVKKILKGSSAFDIIARCAFLHEDTESNNHLYKSSLAALGESAAAASIGGVGFFPVLSLLTGQIAGSLVSSALIDKILSSNTSGASLIEKILNSNEKNNT